MDTANPRMAFGRMALIGDAAFTARPTTGAGTTKAAINGIELGKALHGISTNGVVGALREWEAEQIVIGRTLVARGAAATDNPVVVSVSPASVCVSHLAVRRRPLLPPGHQVGVPERLHAWQAGRDAAARANGERRHRGLLGGPDRSGAEDRAGLFEPCREERAGAATERFLGAAAGNNGADDGLWGGPTGGGEGRQRSRPVHAPACALAHGLCSPLVRAKSRGEDG